MMNVPKSLEIIKSSKLASSHKIKSYPIWLDRLLILYLFEVI